jgi:hypothetical protein
MISVLSLVVAILAVFFGPLIARANVQRQIAVAVREAWMREFRGQVALFLARMQALARHARTRRVDDRESDERLAELNDELLPVYHTIRLLIQERGAQHVEFLQALDGFLDAAGSIGDQLSLEVARSNQRRLIAATADILLHERRTIDTDPGVWRVLWTSLRPWARNLPPDLP